MTIDQKYSKKKIAIIAVAALCAIAVTISLWLHFYDFKDWQYFNKYSFENLKSVKETKGIDFMVVANFFQQEGQRMVCLAKYSSKFDKNRIGWISDIHADRFKRRDVDSGLLYPKKYMEYLPKTFDALSKDGIYTVIATGDNTNTSGMEYARDIEMIAQKKCMDVVWVKGNHDNAEVMNELGISGDAYYYVDHQDTRILVIDDTEYPNDVYGYLGGISEKQYDWIRESVKTDKKIVVAMHIPIFFNDLVKGSGKSLELNDIFIEQYADLEKILSENKNIKIVLSGHYHGPSHKLYNGVDYYVQGALTRDKSEGAYAIIDLNDFSVDYKFAK